jgi:hypothetical protein
MVKMCGMVSRLASLAHSDGGAERGSRSWKNSDIYYWLSTFCLDALTTYVVFVRDSNEIVLVPMVSR